VSRIARPHPAALFAGNHVLTRNNARWVAPYLYSMPVARDSERSDSASSRRIRGWATTSRPSSASYLSCVVGALAGAQEHGIGCPRRICCGISGGFSVFFLVSARASHRPPADACRVKSIPAAVVALLRFLEESVCVLIALCFALVLFLRRRRSSVLVSSLSSYAVILAVKSRSAPYREILRTAGAACNYVLSPWWSRRHRPRRVATTRVLRDSTLTERFALVNSFAMRCFSRDFF